MRIPPRWLTFPLIPRPCAWPSDREPPRASSGSAPNASAQPKPTPAASSIPLCDKPSGTGLARIVEVDTTGGPGFGFEHFKQYDFLRDKEIVLTFDDGPWPGNTPAVLKALTDECLKATFFEIGGHATWHPEITKQVIAAGMTVGTHTCISSSFCCCCCCAHVGNALALSIMCTARLSTLMRGSGWSRSAGLLTAVRTMDRCAAAIAPAACR